MDKFLEQFRLVDFLGYFCPGCVLVLMFAAADFDLSVQVLRELENMPLLIVFVICFPIVFSIGLIVSLVGKHVLSWIWERSFEESPDCKRLLKLVKARCGASGVLPAEGGDSDLGFNDFFCLANAIVRQSRLSFLADRAYAMYHLLAGLSVAFGVGLLVQCFQFLRQVSIVRGGGMLGTSLAVDSAGWSNLLLGLVLLVLCAASVWLSRFSRSGPWEEVATACVVAMGFSSADEGKNSKRFES